MSKRYYNHRQKRYSNRIFNGIFKFSKAERMVFNIIRDLIIEVVYLIKGIIHFLIVFPNYLKNYIINNRKLKNLGYNYEEVLNMVYNLQPRQFEIFCAELFKQCGFSVELTPSVNDYGRDIILNGNIFVECKHYKGQVGREICQKLLGSVTMFGAEKAIIITTGTYHKNAYEVANMVDSLTLMDIHDIQDMLLNLNSEQIAKIVMRTKNAA